MENSGIHEIPLYNKKRDIVGHAIVDECDWENARKHKWHMHLGYAYGQINKVNIFLHHFIHGKPDHGYVIDHKNRNRLDNRRENLREITYSENAKNKSKNKDHSSQFFGVGWHIRVKKFTCTYCRKHVGYFDDEVEAGLAFDKMAFITEGEFPLKTNGLIGYEEAINTGLNTATLRERNLPHHIQYNKKADTYRAHITYQVN